MGKVAKNRNSKFSDERKSAKMLYQRVSMIVAVEGDAW
jgi:hypothetical protein